MKYVHPWYKIDHQKNIIDFRIENQYIEVEEALKKTIEIIVNNYPPPYRLMVSGGIDSQAMIYSWIKYGKNFIPTSVVYTNNLNDYDLESLRAFSNQQKLDVEYVNFNLLDFYQTTYNQIAEKYRCISPHFGAHLGMIENLNGTCIFSGDMGFDGGIGLFPANMCVLRASFVRPIVPYFFFHTPELAYAGAYTLKKQGIKPRKNTPDTVYENKSFFYKKLGFPIIPQVKKFTGFEKVKEYYDEYFTHLITTNIRLKYASKESNRTYDLLLRYPYEEKYQEKKFTYLINKIK